MHLFIGKPHLASASTVTPSFSNGKYNTSVCWELQQSTVKWQTRPCCKRRRLHVHASLIPNKQILKNHLHRTYPCSPAWSEMILCFSRTSIFMYLAQAFIQTKIYIWMIHALRIERNLGVARTMIYRLSSRKNIWQSVQRVTWSITHIYLISDIEIIQNMK